MLRVVGLAAQWERIQASLPDDWEHAELRLQVPEERSRTRASALLGPLSPGRVGADLRFAVSRGSGVGPQAARRLLAKLDDEGIAGKLALSGSASVAEVADEAPSRPPLGDEWDRLLGELPEDWSDLLCRVELASSDDLPQAALLAAPLNPSRPRGELGFDFRVARRFGYGASPEMTRRCFERLDEAGIPGRLELLRALSDTQPVATQGPVWYVAGKVQ
jgi:hypothetical protein